MSLALLQRELLDTLLDPAEPADARLAVYHRSVRANRNAALAASYPVVLRLVGRAYFGEAAARFADAFPSRSGDLNAYGADFARFLERYPHARELAYLPDVARLEWAVHESAHAAEGPAFDYAALGSIPAERLGEVRIELMPCVRRVSSVHPIASIWEANQEGRDGTPSRTPGGERVVVRRDAALQARPLAVEAGEWTLIEAFARGITLAEAAAECERLDVALEPALRGLASLGVLGGFEVARA